MKKKKIIYFIIFSLLITLILSLTDNYGSIKKFISQALGYNTAINIDSLPKIKEIENGYYLFDDGKMYINNNGKMDLIAENIKEILFAKEYQFFYTYDKQIVYTSLDEFNLQPFIADVEKILNADYSFFVKKSDNKYYDVVMKNGVAQEKVIDFPSDTYGEIVEELDNYYLTDTNDVYRINTSFEAPGWRHVKYNISDLVYLNDYYGTSFGFIWGKTFTDINGHTSFPKIKQYGSNYALVSEGYKTLSLWGETDEFYEINGVQEVLYADDLFIEFLTSKNEKKIYKLHNNDSYKWVETVPNFPTKEYDKGFYFISSTSYPDDLLKPLYEGYYLNENGEFKYNNDEVIDTNIKGFIHSMQSNFSVNPITNNGSTSYTYEGYYIDQNGNLYDLDKTNKQLILTDIEFVDENYNYVIDKYGRYYGFIGNDLYQWTFEDNENVELRAIKDTAMHQNDISVNEQADYNKYIYYPVNHTDNLNYSVTNGDISSIDDNGILTALDNGTTQVIVTNNNGRNLFTSDDIIIHPLIETIEFTSDYNNAYINNGSTSTICVQIGPSDVLDKSKFTIDTGDNIYVTSTSNYGNGKYCMQMRAYNEAANNEILVFANDNPTVFASAYVHTIKQASNIKSLSGVGFPVKDELDVNFYNYLDKPFTYTNKDFFDSLYFESTDTDIITVDEEGSFTIVGKGSAAVDVKAKIINRNGGLDTYQVLKAGYLSITDYKSIFDDILSNIPDETIGVFDETIADEQARALIDQLLDGKLKKDYTLNIISHDDFIYEIEISKTLGNGVAAKSSKKMKVNIINDEDKKLIEDVKSIYKLNYYDSFYYESDEELKALITSKIKADLNTENVIITLEQSSVIENYLELSYIYNAIIQIDNKYFYKEIKLEKIRTFTVDYDVRYKYDAVNILIEDIKKEEHFKDLEFRYGFYTDPMDDLGISNYGQSYVVPDDLDYYYPITILRKDNPLTKIDIKYDDSDMVMYNYKKIILEPIITPDDAIYEDIVWTLDSNENITLTEEYDTQKAILEITKPGTYQITASSADGKISKTVTLVLKKPQSDKLVSIMPNNTGQIYYLYDDGSVFGSGNFYSTDNTWINTSKVTFIRGNIKKIINTNGTYRPTFITTKNKLVLNTGKELDIEDVKDAIIITSDYFDIEMYILTNNGDVYHYIYEYYDSEELNKLSLSGIKELKNINSTIFALSHDQNLYVWGQNVFGEKFNNGVYIDNPMLLSSGVSSYSYRYLINDNQDLYYWSERVLNPTIIDSNVDNVIDYIIKDYHDYYDYIYYEKDNTTYINDIYIKDKYIQSDIEQIDHNVKEIYDKNFYVTNDDVLHFYGDNSVNNVKEIRVIPFGNEEINVYITNDNKLYQIEKRYNTYLGKNEISTYFISDNIAEFISNEILLTTDKTAWIWGNMASGAVNMSENDGINYPAKIVTELDEDPISAQSIYIYSGTTKYLTVGDTLDILAVVLPYNTTNKKIIWSVNDENLANITQDGLLTALGAGTVTVTAKTEDGNHENSIHINIHPKPNGIKLNTDDINTYIYSDDYNRGIGNICANILPDETLIHDLNWTSSDENIVKITSEYIHYNDEYDNCVSLMLTKSATGDVTITASTLDGKYSKSFDIHVIKDISSYSTIDEIVVGEEKAIFTELNPNNYPKELITYQVKDGYQDIISVTSNGIVKGLKEGYGQVYVCFGASYSLTSNPNCDYIHISVEEEKLQISTDIDYIYIEASPSGFTDRGTINADYYRLNNSSTSVIWKSSDESILKILPSTEENSQRNPSTNFVIGTKTGEVTLTATSSDGKLSDSITFNVIKVPFPTEDIIIDVSKTSTYQIPKFMPENFTDNDYGYDVQNSNIVTISNTGLITARQEGETKIRILVRVINTTSSYAFKDLNVKVINSGNYNSLTINPEGKVVYGSDGDNYELSIPIKSFTVTLVADKTTTKKVEATFNGWTLTGGGLIKNNIYTFGDTNAVATAKWKYNKVTLTNPTKKGYTFAGWYTDPLFKNKFNKDTLITSNISLYAKFTKNEEEIKIARGDANNDGKIPALDYVKVKNHIMKSSIITNSNELYGADMNADGNITALDYVAIKNKIMKG